MSRSALSKFLRLPMPDRILLVRSVLSLATARMALWILPFRIARRLLTRRRPRAVSANISHEKVRWAISVAKRVVPKATCVPQALAAESLLTRGGLPAELHIGVMKSPVGKLEAHAWVESGGQIVVGDLPWGLDGYTRLPKLPEAWPHPGSAGNT